MTRVKSDDHETRVAIRLSEFPIRARLRSEFQSTFLPHAAPDLRTEYLVEFAPPVGGVVFVIARHCPDRYPQVRVGPEEALSEVVALPSRIGHVAVDDHEVGPQRSDNGQQP